MVSQFKVIGFISFLSILSSLLGVIRESTIASTFGASRVTDIFLLSSNFINFIYICIGTSLTTVVIPLISEIKKDNESDTDRKLSNMFLSLVLLLIIITLITMLLTKKIILIMAPGFNADEIIQSTEMSRIMLPGLFLMGLSSIITGYLQVIGKFSIPALVGVIFNIVFIIIILFLSNLFGTYSLAFAWIIATSSQLVIQIPYLLKNGFKFHFSFRIRDQYLLKMWKLFTPIFLGTLLTQISPVIERGFATYLEPGSIAIFGFAYIIYSIPANLMINSIITVSYPSLVNCYISKDDATYNSKFNKVIVTILILMIPASFGIVSFKELIVDVLFKRGAFDSIAANKTTELIIYFSIGMVAGALNNFLYKVFYSLNNSVIPMVTGVVISIINIGLNILLIPKMGVNALALALSVSTIISVCVLLTILYLKMKVHIFKNVFISGVKVLISSTIMLFVVNLCLDIITKYIVLNNVIINLLVMFSISVVGVFIFIASNILLKTSEILIFKQRIMRELYSKKGVN